MSKCAEEMWLQEWHHAVYDNVAVPHQMMAVDNFVTT